MDALTIGMITIALIGVFLGSGVWIFAGLLLVGVSILVFVLGFPLDRVGFIMKGILWRASNSWEIASIPMFIFMGEMIYRSDMSDRIFRGLAVFVEHLPGRLLHTNIAGCTLFAAVSGSSAATTATIGKITTRTLLGRGYHSGLAVGSLAGAGSLGLLIPPSIVMIIYGVLAEVSIARLFAAGLLPGLLVAFLYSSYIGIRGVMSEEIAPSRGKEFDMHEIGPAFLDLVPIMFLIAVVLGGIYTGVTTPSEAAAVGVVATIVVTLLLRRLTFEIFWNSLMSAIAVSAMVVSIVVSAAFLSTAMGYSHVPRNLALLIASWELTPFALIAVLAIFYLVLGLFLDGISITVMSLPITLPLALQAGWDPIWFGIFLVIMIELAQITPPVGFNLFVIQGLTGWNIGRIAAAAAPFFLLMCLAAVFIVIWPEIALWLPGQIWQSR